MLRMKLFMLRGGLLALLTGALLLAYPPRANAQDEGKVEARWASTATTGVTAQGGLTVRYAIGLPFGISHSANGDIALYPAPLASAVAASEITPVEVYKALPLAVSPNPANGWVALRGLEAAQRVEVRVLTALGQTILAQQLSVEEGVARLYVGSLPQGLYILQATDAQGQRHGNVRLIVEK